MTVFQLVNGSDRVNLYDLANGDIVEGAGAIRQHTWPLKLGLDVRTQVGANVSIQNVTFEGTGNFQDSWRDAKDNNTAQIGARGGVITLENARQFNAPDSFRPNRGTNASFIMRGCWFTFIRDDAIENDSGWPGAVEDCLIDGCYRFLSTSSAGATPGVVSISDTVIAMKRMPGARDLLPEGSAGHGSAIKYDTAGTINYSNVVIAYENVAVVSGNYSMAPSTYNLFQGSTNNVTIVWPQELVDTFGAYPGDTTGDITVVNDWAVYEAARDDWVANHPALWTLPNDPFTMETAADNVARIVELDLAGASTWTVAPSGGDYTTLAAALSNPNTGSGDTIEISGDWSGGPDTTAATVSDSNITILTTGQARHVGFDDSNDNYKLSVSTGHALTISANNCSIDGLIIEQAGIGTSAECIRYGGPDGSTLTVINTILRCTGTVTNQDCVYFPASVNQTGNFENCIFIGAGRAAVYLQNSGSVATQVLNLISCVAWANGGITGAFGGGGICAIATANGVTCNVNAHNCLAIGNTAGDAAWEDFYQQVGGTGTANWNLDNCFSGDASISARDIGAVNATENVTITDAAPGAGDIAAVNDITAAPYDLRLQDDANNDAQDQHANATGATLTIGDYAGAVDIDGTIRPQNTNYDIGAFEVFNPPTVAITGTIDGLLQRQAALQTATLDGLLQSTFSSSSSFDAFLQRQGLVRQAVLDASLTKGGSIAAVMDALITRLSNTRTGTMDAILLQPGSRAALIDAILRSSLSPSTLTAACDIDAILYKAWGKTPDWND